MFWVNKIDIKSHFTREETEVAELGLELNLLSVFQCRF